MNFSNLKPDFVTQNIPQKSTLNDTAYPLVPTGTRMLTSNIRIPSQNISHSQPISKTNLNLDTSAKENNIGTEIKKKDKKKNKKNSELNLNERIDSSNSKPDFVTQNIPQKSTLNDTAYPLVPTGTRMLTSNIRIPSQNISHSQPISKTNLNLDTSAKENNIGTEIKKKDKKKNKKNSELNLNERIDSSNSKPDFVTQNIPQKSTLNDTAYPLVPTGTRMLTSNIRIPSQNISHSQPISKTNLNLDTSAKENNIGTEIKKKDKKKNKKNSELNLNERIDASNSKPDFVTQNIPQKSTLNDTAYPLVPTGTRMLTSNIRIPSQNISHSQPISKTNLNLDTSAKENNIGTEIKKKDKKKNKKNSELNLNERIDSSNSKPDFVTQNIPQKSTLNDTAYPLVPTGTRMLTSNIRIPSQNISHSQPISKTNLNLDTSAKENNIGTEIKKKDKKKNKKNSELNLNERIDASNSKPDFVTQNIPQKSTLNDTAYPLVPTGTRMLTSNIRIPSQNISHSQPISKTNLNLDISAIENNIGTVIKKKDKKKNKKNSELNLNERIDSSNSKPDFVTQNIPQKSTLNDTAYPLVPTGTRMLTSNIRIPSQNISHSQPISKTNLNLDTSAKENNIGTEIKKKDKKKNKKNSELNLNERIDASNSKPDFVTQNIPQKSTLNDTAYPLVPTGTRMLTSNIRIPSQNISHSQPISKTNLNLDISAIENNIGTVIKKKDKFFRRNILLGLMDKKTHNPLSPRPLCLYDYLSLFQKYFLALLTPNIDFRFDSPVNKNLNRTVKKRDCKSKRSNIQHLNVKKVKIQSDNKNKNEIESDDVEIIFNKPCHAYSQCLRMFGKMTKKMKRDFFFDEESFMLVK